VKTLGSPLEDEEEVGDSENPGAQEKDVEDPEGMAAEKPAVAPMESMED
jgi:hypothetical protein